MVKSLQAAAAHAGRTAVGEYLSARLGLKKAGVYAVIDKAGLYQYVGYARSIHDALKVGLGRFSLVTLGITMWAVMSRSQAQLVDSYAECLDIEKDVQGQNSMSSTRLPALPCQV